MSSKVRLTGRNTRSVIEMAAMADDPEKLAARDALARRLGAVLREKRTEKQWSQDFFAKKAGLSRTSVFYIERGDQECTIDTFVRLSNALNLQPSVLLEEI